MTNNCVLENNKIPTSRELTTSIYIHIRRFFLDVENRGHQTKSMANYAFLREVMADICSTIERYLSYLELITIALGAPIEI
jgi:trans-2-enoyl-CoA reductase